VATPLDFETARKPVPARTRYRKGVGAIFSVFRLLARMGRSLLFEPLTDSLRSKRAPGVAAAFAKVALITLVTAVALATFAGAVPDPVAAPAAAQPGTAAENLQVPFSYTSIMSALDHDDTVGYNPEAYCRTYVREGASTGVPEDPGARRAVFPLPEAYLDSYEDTWGAPRPQGSHEGTDLMVPAGTPEYAVTDGTIVPVSGSNENGWNSLGGYTVMLEAAYSVGPIKEGDLFYYAHLDARSALPTGTKVRAGEQIGVAGDTGQGPEVTRTLFPPHLHLGWYEASGSRSDVASGALNPFPMLEWLKSNGGTVAGGWGSEQATADYCEYQSSSSSAPPGAHQHAHSESSADLDTGSSDPRPSPVVHDAQEAYCQGSGGGARSMASSDAWRGVLPAPAKFFYSLFERIKNGVAAKKCEEDLAPSYPTQPGNGKAEDLLANPNFEASPQAVEDLRAGIVDERLIATLQAIVEKHRIYVNVFKTGHTFGLGFPEGPTIPTGYGSGAGYTNTHYFGRAADVWEVDGVPILGCGSHPAVVDVGTMLGGIPPQQRPDVIIGPSAWSEALGPGREDGWILDDDQVARHEDHLHLGYYSEEGTSNTVSPALGSQEDNGGGKQDEACSGGLRERPGASLGEHRSGYGDHPETRVDPQESNATPSAGGRAADNENRPGKITPARDRQIAPPKTPGRFVHPQEAPERRSATGPEKKPVREKPEETGPVAEPDPQESEQASPETSEPGNQEPEEPAPPPAPVAGETDNPEPEKPANEETGQPEPGKSEPKGPETGSTEPDGAESEEPERPEPPPAETVGYGSILPIAFHDRDGDGVHDADEEQLAGFSATLISTGEPTIAETGTPFEGLREGNYVVTVEPAAGYAATSPQERARVRLKAHRERVLTFGFLEKPAEATVLVCDDTNADSFSCADEGIPESP